MSEKISPNPEHHKQPEQLNNVERVNDGVEKPKADEQQEHLHAEHLESIKHEAKNQAKSGQEISVDEAQPEHSEHHFAGKELKSEALRRSLQRTRKHLSPVSKSFSKVIHAPVIDSVSKLGEKTIARPKGILTGAVVALIGSSWVLYSAKHYGFTYNYLIVIILFGGGYLVGLALELLWYALHRRRHSN